MKTHQDRVPLLRRFDRRPSPAIQLEYAVYALQRARDDAHIAAWRSAGLEGPDIEVLSHLWATDARTMDELVGLTQTRLKPDDVSAALGRIERQDYASRRRGEIRISDHGRKTRDVIEHETDRIYFAPWPQLDAAWIFDQLETVTAHLAATSPPS